MNSESRVTVPWAVLAAAALALFVAGGGAAYLGLRPGVLARPAPSEDAGMANSSPLTVSALEGAAPAVAAGALADVTLTLTKEAIDRAGIKTAVVGGGTTAGGVRAPGVVQPNAYKQVIVTPIVSGRITRVTAELGQRVQRGQTIAQIFSPELADAETRYISARAMLGAHEKELARTEKLVEIGAGSQQELERIHAEHAARGADVQSAASRLQLLGLDPAAIEALGSGQTESATTSVPSPLAGVVTERLANVGLNVDPATKLFTIVDLSTVWVVADVYETDFARFHLGSGAVITTQAYPDLVLHGRVSYIDPQVSADTRTAKVRIEVSNARAELHLGMYVDVVLAAEGGASTPTIPRSAVQNVGDRTVVYLADSQRPGTFIEREVRLGAASGDQVAVLTGVKQADVVVGEGSFYIRAERERLGLRAPVARGPSAGGPTAAAAPVVHGDVRVPRRVPGSLTRVASLNGGRWRNGGGPIQLPRL